MSMDLDSYLSSPGALSVSELRVAIGAKSDAQIRQWRKRWQGRVPSPPYCVLIERATRQAVMRWDLRPDDWHLNWPDLIGRKGAPRVKQSEAVA